MASKSPLDMRLLRVAPNPPDCPAPPGPPPPLLDCAVPRSTTRRSTQAKKNPVFYIKMVRERGIVGRVFFYWFVVPGLKGLVLGTHLFFLGHAWVGRSFDVRPRKF